MSVAPTLVTGAGGFVGSWLVPELEAAGHRVIAATRAHADLRDRDAVQLLIRDAKPRFLVHLAGIAQPACAARDPLEALRANTLAVAHLLDALVAHAPHCRLLFVSSGEVYGLRAADAPAPDESAPLAPPTVYSATKVAAERMCELAQEQHGLDVVRVRPFNHSGPGRPDTYVESSFAKQLVAIERGEQEPVVRVGNLGSIRDFSDVRDVVRAYVRLLERGESGQVYNVCSGVPRSIRSLLDALVARARIQPRIKVDPERYRPDTPERQAIYGNPGRIRALGWEPRIPFEQMLDDLLGDWRSRS